MVHVGQGSKYVAPSVTDYGDLVTMTSVVHPLLGDATVHDLSFSSPAPGTPGALGGQMSLYGQGSAPADGSGDEPGGAGLSPGAGGAASGAGGSLPFTGFAPGVAALIGAGFTSAGIAIRRVLRRT